MGVGRRFMALCLSVLLLGMMHVTAYAHDVPDTSKKGTISISMMYEDKEVPGGTLTLYQVGEIEEDDGNYSFILNSDFKDSGANLTELSDPELAENLAKYAEDRKCAGMTETIDAHGKIIFAEQETGLYLLVQHEAADGYSKISPFLVSIPMEEDGTYVYTVDASPKMELKKEPATTSTTPEEPTTPEKPTMPGKPETPTTPSKPAVPGNPTLPQTGQLNWPIPILAVSGLLLFLGGWLLRFGRKRDSYEK